MIVFFNGWTYMIKYHAALHETFAVKYRVQQYDADNCNRNWKKKSLQNLQILHDSIISFVRNSDKRKLTDSSNMRFMYMRMYMREWSLTIQQPKSRMKMPCVIVQWLFALVRMSMCIIFGTQFIYVQRACACSQR